MTVPHGADPSGPAWRVGDAEREAAVAALGEHFALGRLDREEYDERSERAYAARFDRDLAALFADLPTPHGPSPARGPARQPTPGWSRRGPGPRRRVVPLGPLFFAAFVVACVTHAFWVLFLVPLFAWCVVRPARRWHHGSPRGWRARTGH